MNENVSLAVLIVLTVGNYWVKRSLLYPPFLFCGMWLLATSLTWLELIETDPVHPETWTVFTVGAIFFTVGGLLAQLVPRIFVETRLVLTRFPRRNKLFKPLLVLFLCCGIPLLVQNLRAQAAQGTGGNFFERARNGGINAQREGTGIEGMAPGYTIYFTAWTVFAAVMFMLEKKDKAFWLMAGIALLEAVLTTGRTSILQLFASLICVHLMTTGRTRFWAALKVARIPISIFACLYLGLIFINKSQQSQFYGDGMIQIAIFFFVSYIIGPLAAFDAYLRSPQSLAAIPNHTFKFFLTIAGHLHLINYVPANIIQEFQTVPYPVNVYTIYKDFTMDFGVTGALIALLIVGFLHTLLYRKALTGSLIGRYLFALSMFPVMMSIFNDQYSALGVWTDAILFAAIYIFLQSLSVRFLPRTQAGYGVPLYK